MDAPGRHLRLLTETIAAVNSTLDLEEVLGLVARKVAEALDTDACFVYLYDQRADELVLRATHGTRVEEMTRRPKLRPGEGITGSAAAERSPIMIPAQAHLDPRFRGFSNLPEDEYESILAVPILARAKLAGALNVRTRRPREFSEAEIELLVAIAAQVAQTIEHAKLYAEAQQRVGELEALARISEAVSESLYLEESLEAIVRATIDAVDATGAALVLEDGGIARPEGRPGAFAVRIPLRWKGRRIGELVCDRDTDFTADERALLASIAHHAAAALEPVSLAGNRATALALVFSELFQNALEHGGNQVRIELASRNGRALLAITDDGGVDEDIRSGTGLSIVRALVRDELQGTFDLRGDSGTRAEVLFPA